MNYDKSEYDAIAAQHGPLVAQMWLTMRWHGIVAAGEVNVQTQPSAAGQIERGEWT